ncbi:MAG: ribonuclease J [Parcubacteria group bacterium Licking1014_17]|nr:MAG: ribonuclease J [Parcubacteria group bacterium Licking1014_17]
MEDATNRNKTEYTRRKHGSEQHNPAGSEDILNTSGDSALQTGPRSKKAPRFKSRRDYPKGRRLAPIDGRPHREETRDDTLKIIPLGGLGEVGRNMTAFEFKEDIIVVDAGFGYPEEDQPGIDYNLPNTTYLEENKNRIRAIVITHGHYDHIGSLPYIIQRIGNPPLYAGNIARGIIMKRHLEFPELPELDITVVDHGDKITLGSHFTVEFFHLNHNIPDSFGLVITTPAASCVHTGDFKFDPKPLNEKPADFDYISKIGDRGITLLMSDSTGAEKEGGSISESTIQDNLEVIFKEARGRIITSTFSSLLNRIQQLITLSEKYGRKVAFDGYSLKSNVEYAKESGQLQIRNNTQIPIEQIDEYPDEKITIIGTGAQGEDRAVLMRIASGEHKYIQLKKMDSVVFSSSVVPGNERTVQRIKDLFYRFGARVYHYGMMDIHASGHANKEDLRRMLTLIRPKFFMPIYGYYSMLINHKYIAKEVGFEENEIIIADNGSIIHVTDSEWWFDKKTVPANNIMVDGLGVGDIGNVVMRDRQVLSEDGMFVIIALVDSKTGYIKGSPDIISRGFIYLKDNKDLLMQVRRRIKHTVEKKTTRPINWTYLKDAIRDDIGLFLFQKTERRPMILPVVIEV